MEHNKQTIRPGEVCKILCIGRSTLDRWVARGILRIAKRLPSTQNCPFGERRFYLSDILALEKEFLSRGKR
jgi:predicted DNA-binding transcriptional regulator AlpA